MYRTVLAVHSILRMCVRPGCPPQRTGRARRGRRLGHAYDPQTHRALEPAALTSGQRAARCGGSGHAMLVSRSWRARDTKDRRGPKRESSGRHRHNPRKQEQEKRRRFPSEGGAGGCLCGRSESMSCTLSAGPRRARERGERTGTGKGVVYMHFSELSRSSALHQITPAPPPAEVTSSRQRPKRAIGTPQHLREATSWSPMHSRCMSMPGESTGRATGRSAEGGQS
ncbi:hypothetical protein CALCODRAFT_155046 [Calocera cornea HHB12733]|uniref:Uncharacterized protein n=1 Tax=Calocera cornea HHB12733 TaxID=1353952 RepID=A0A165CLX6_9BASI|nr:hypothetical protein CALCODRAFT_155046 [Calocera cornea HHB12733]